MLKYVIFFVVLTTYAIIYDVCADNLFGVGENVLVPSDVESLVVQIYLDIEADTDDETILRNICGARMALNGKLTIHFYFGRDLQRTGNCIADCAYGLFYQCYLIVIPQPEEFMCCLFNNGARSQACSKPEIDGFLALMDYCERVVYHDSGYVIESVAALVEDIAGKKSTYPVFVVNGNYNRYTNAQLHQDFTSTICKMYKTMPKLCIAYMEHTDS